MHPQALMLAICQALTDTHIKLADCLQPALQYP